MKSDSNRYLIVQKGVVLTPICDETIYNLDKEFEAEGKVAYVTSCVRTEESQLSTIRGYLAKTGLDKKYPEALICKPTDKLPSGNYIWQNGWSALLNAGIIINPPIGCKTTMIYTGSNGIVRPIGHFVSASGHIRGSKTTCFDIGGGTDGIDGNVVSEEKIIQKAIDKKMPGIRALVKERKNNCCHVECV